MTDKQIIIDGCDVSGCSLYEDNPKYRMWGTCDCMRSMVDQSGYDELAGAECKGYNCYYKQLKRSEAQSEAMFVTHTDLEKKYKAKEQECEEFRKANDEKNELLAKLGCPTIATAKRKVFCLQEQIDKLKVENDSLKKQLQFEFDETLLQYSNTIEDLQKQLKDSVMQKCPQCGETYLNPVGSKLYEALIEIKELVQSDYCTEIGSCEFCAEIGNCLNRKILHKISEVIDE